MTEAAKITIPVEAEIGRISGQLAQAEQIVAQGTKRIADTAERNDPMKRWFRREQVAFIIGGIGHIAGAVAGLAQAMRTGDVDGYVQAIERLPLGLGAAAQGFHALYDELSGFNAEMERLNAITARQNQIQTQKDAAASERSRAVRSAEDADLQRRLLEAGSDEDRTRIQREFDIKRAREDADRRIRELNDPMATADLEREFEAKRALAEAKASGKATDPSKFLQTAQTALGGFTFAAPNQQLIEMRRAAKAAEDQKKEQKKQTALLEKIATNLAVFR